jgi:hypothetical protein
MVCIRACRAKLWRTRVSNAASLGWKRVDAVEKGLVIVVEL